MRPVKARVDRGSLAVLQHRTYVTLMRFIPALICLTLLSASPAWSQTKPSTPPATQSDPSVPKVFGRFGDWRAASRTEAGQLVCYAYTQASKSTPAVEGRASVTLTVTQRPLGPRDAVSLSPGFAYAANASLQASVDAVAVDFYPDGRYAFARDGKVAVQAFLKGNAVHTRSPNAKSGTVTDSFSLKGFAAAYAAISKACPPK